ncbi:MAG: LuxR C-terminal-related transcriptional regulator [Actinomycetota bacterium]|nr:response regulator transcription factor [Actinomycetota bacterium]
MKILVLGRQDLGAITEKAEGVGAVEVVPTAESAIDSIERDAPDIVIIDFDLPGASGMERLRRVHSGSVEIAKIIVVDDQDPALLSEAMGAGASGVLSRPTPRLIADAIQVVRAGGSYLDPLRTRVMVQRLGEAGADDTSAERVVLTKREHEILSFLAKGLSARQVASRLRLSERTINTHVANLYRKLDVSNRVEAVRKAMTLGLVNIAE